MDMLAMRQLALRTVFLWDDLLSWTYEIPMRRISRPGQHSSNLSNCFVGLIFQQVLVGRFYVRHVRSTAFETTEIPWYGHAEVSCKSFTEDAD